MSVYKIFFSITEEEYLQELINILYKSLKKIVSDKMKIDGINRPKTINSIIKLIMNVINTGNEETALVAIKCLSFMLKNIEKKHFDIHAHSIYGMLVRSLCFRYGLIVLFIDLGINIFLK